MLDALTGDATGATEAPSLADPGSLPDEWRELYEERAAIMEYDGGLPRERAEAKAMADTCDRMRRAGCLPNNDACNVERYPIQSGHDKESTL